MTDGLYCFHDKKNGRQVTITMLYQETPAAVSLLKRSLPVAIRVYLQQTLAAIRVQFEEILQGVVWEGKDKQP